MKLILLAALLLPMLAFSQGAQPIPPQRRITQAPSSSLPDNYKISLIITDKEGQPTEVSVVVASTQFSVSLGEPNLSFSGTVNVEEAGGITIAYFLGWETPITSGNGNIQYRASSAQGSVRLKDSEEVEVMRAGPRIARLAIHKLEPAKAK